MTLKRLDLHHLNLDFLVLMLAICFMSGTKPVCASNDEPAEYNRRATATAQILAGITPNPADPALKRLVESEAFKEHQQWMTTSWNQMRNRIQTMDAWRTHEIKIPGAQKKNWLIPSLDRYFLTPTVFFPNLAGYVFLSFERPACRPDPDP